MRALRALALVNEKRASVEQVRVLDRDPHRKLPIRIRRVEHEDRRVGQAGRHALARRRVEPVSLLAGDHRQDAVIRRGRRSRDIKPAQRWQAADRRHGHRRYAGRHDRPIRAAGTYSPDQ
eukprot:5148984-Prymnesium_polylepis.4